MIAISKADPQHWQLVDVANYLHRNVKLYERFSNKFPRFVESVRVLNKMHEVEAAHRGLVEFGYMDEVQDWVQGNTLIYWANGVPVVDDEQDIRAVMWGAS